MNLEHAALVLIDVQQGFDESNYWGQRNNPNFEANIASLLKTWRKSHRPILHVQHNSIEPRSPLRPSYRGNDFKPEALPQLGEAVFGKTVNSAFIGTDLENHLRQHGLNTLVIAGLTTDHCVSTTTRMAGNLGFEVYLIGDGCATFDKKSPTGEWITADEVQRVNLASLHNEFCTVVQTQEVLEGEFV